MHFNVAVQPDHNLRLVALVEGERAEATPLGSTSTPQPSDVLGMDEIYDLSGAGRLVLDRGDVVALREAWAGSRSALPGRLAIVAPSDLAFGLARMYVAMAEGSNVHRDRRVFRRMSEAKAWLGLPEAWSPTH